MPRYYIQQNLLSSQHTTLVRNELGKIVFLMVGSWGSRGDVLSLYAVDGDLVAKIRQSSLHVGIGSNFHLYYHFKKIGTLHRLFSFQKDFYFVHRLGWVVVGDIPNHAYNIYSFQEKIMQMQKTYHAKGSFYELDTVNEELAPICICIAAVLDYWQINRKKEPVKIPKNLPEYSFKIKDCMNKVNELKKDD